MSLYLFYFAISLVLMGFSMKRVTKNRSSYEIAYQGSFACLILTILTMLAYYLRSFTLNSIIIFLWGLIVSIHRSNCFSLYSKHFNNDINMYGVHQFYCAFSGALFIFLLSMTLKISILVSFILLIITFSIITRCCYRMKDKYQE